MAQVQDIEIRDSAALTAAAAEELQDVQGEKMVLNMGPSHPATHGVLRIVWNWMAKSSPRPIRT